ncbi:MAG: ABC transporter permease [Deltaproteobacteria bacterium]|nr:ABC transporter permease [Deltaproteobacteria bacterium]MBW2017797.1 ABC transporter permease [Deltaproteobacteria bacterium]MBW2128035.1 ABC transporter permease [Deltaproteobacteria bacterium]MBW2305038.1 ABC transporter permease [Deltaproteobacteria bacterium]
MVRALRSRYRISIGLPAVFLAAALFMVFLSYALPRLLPGDFVTAMYASSNVTLSEEQEAALRSYYTSQETFREYLMRWIRLDWGYSYAYMTPVSSLFFEALPWTLLLLGSANLLSLTLGFFLGVEAAWRWDSRGGKWLVGWMTLFEGMPEMVTGVLLLLIFALHLGWFPAAGAETAYADLSFFKRVADVGHHLALPLLTLVVAYVPGNFLLTRNSMMIFLRSPFTTTARAKGLSARRVRYAHVARNALLPLVTRFGLRVSFMVTGALVVERIHAYPGLGTLLFNAIQARDLPVIQGVVLMSSLMVLAVILCLETVYRILDPRIGYAS